jgi:hypothetical protein
MRTATPFTVVYTPPEPNFHSAMVITLDREIFYGGFWLQHQYIPLDVHLSLPFLEHAFHPLPAL